MKTFLSIVVAASLAACHKSGPIAPEEKMKVATSLERGGGRFSVQMLSTFTDDLAYGDKRAIYLITDTTTGAEYFGVSGIGISELGSHTVQTGKHRTTVPDER